MWELLRNPISACFYLYDGRPAYREKAAQLWQPQSHFVNYALSSVGQAVQTVH